MAQANATELQPANGFMPSPDLSTLLAQLSPAQAQAVIRIAESELTGQSVESLFEGTRKICSRTTYYRKRGWVHKIEFQAALAQARREIRNLRLVDIVEEAIAELKFATPLAAADLRRQIAGDETATDALAVIARNKQKKPDERIASVEALANIGTPRATGVLLAVLGDADKNVHLAAINALGTAAAGINGPRRLADVAVLDRADKATAHKGASANEFDGLEEEELDQVIANLQIAIGAGADGKATPASQPQPA